MIQLKPTQEVLCLKSITEFTEGKKYSVRTQKVSGRMYKPGKRVVNDRHEWIDKEGQLENKIMLFSDKRILL